MRQGKLPLRDGRMMGYAEYGDPAGIPVLQFHGTPSSRLLHPDSTITTLLGARHIILERPGFGLSDFQPGRTMLDWPDDVEDAAVHLGLDRFAVVGASGGGPYVAACAHKIPHRLTAAAICGGMAPIEETGILESLPPVRRVGAKLGRRAPWLLRPLLWLTQNPQHNPDRFLARYTSHNLAPDRTLLSDPGFLAMLRANYLEATRRGIGGFAWEVRLVSNPWGFALKQITLPVHLWHGEEDSSTPLIMAEYMARAMPHSRLTVLRDEGHLLLFTRWEEILRSLLEA
jgi:pimeloyl-ACP methyl ester carboxylesterase